MRKLIDIKDEILIDLKVLAALENKCLKIFIENELEKLVKDKKKKERMWAEQFNDKNMRRE